jgi:hypothetical protein
MWYIHNFRDWCCHLHSSCSSAMQRQMIVLAYLGRQSTECHTAEWTCWFFTSFYLESCICPGPFPRWIRQRNSIEFCANFGKPVAETLAMIRQAWDVRRCLNGMSKLTETEKGKTREEQIQEHAHHFLCYQSDCSQIVRPGRPNSQSVTFYSASVEICDGFSPNPGDKMTGCCFMTMRCLTLSFWPETTRLLSPTQPTRLTWPPATSLRLCDWK